MSKRKNKYTYQVYDYSFLNKNKPNSWKEYFNSAVKVTAKTIGFDLVDVHPLSEPVGQLYWMDYTTTNATVGNYTTSPCTITYSTGPSYQPITISNCTDFYNVYNR